MYDELVFANLADSFINGFITDLNQSSVDPTLKFITNWFGDLGKVTTFTKFHCSLWKEAGHKANLQDWVVMKVK